MYKYLIFSVLLLIFIVSSCKRIDAGYTGILFNHYGITDDKGVSDRKVVSGIIWYNPFMRSVYEYPHFWQEVTYDEISFNSLEGEPITTDLSIVYRFNKDYIAEVFDSYRSSPKDLQVGIIENIVLESLNTQAGKVGAVDIMGRGREDLLRKVTDSLNAIYNPHFEFDLVTFSSKLIPSENVDLAIQGVIGAQEATKKAQAKTMEEEENMKQRIMSAKADSTSRMIQAVSRAKEIELIQAQIARSPQYIEYLKANKWDGKLPQVSGNVTPFLNLDK